MSDRTETIHPKIGALQEHLNLIDRSLREGNYLQAMEESYLCIIEMNPLDRPSELANQIKREVNSLTKAKPTQLRTLYRLRRWNFYNVYEQLSDTLWKKNYFTNNKYGNSRSLKELREIMGDDTKTPDEEEDD